MNDNNVTTIPRTTRCKFVCNTVETRLVRGYTKYNNNGLPEREPDKMVYTARFTVVSDGSEENKKFFLWTPSGDLSIGTYTEDRFQVGKEYYLDLTLALNNTNGNV